MEPSIRLVSYTAYPLETLYIVSTELENPEIPAQKPDELRKLLYTELSENLKKEQKEFILAKMQQCVETEIYLSNLIKFTFIIKNINFDDYNNLNLWKYFPSVCVGTIGNINDRKNVALTIGIEELISGLGRGYAVTEFQQSIAKAAVKEIQKVEPHLAELMLKVYELQS